CYAERHWQQHGYQYDCRECERTCGLFIADSRFTMAKSASTMIILDTICDAAATFEQSSLGCYHCGSCVPDNTKSEFLGTPSPAMLSKGNTECVEK
ncbi:hypothetical protein JG688_00004881, partial [Phytophthora aleatoria]